MSTNVYTAPLARVFSRLDEDGDGKVSMEELRLCFIRIGEELADGEIEMLLKSVDADGDGLLGLDDLAKLLEGRGKDDDGEDEEDVKAAFGVYEMDGLGQITAASLRRTLSRLGNSTSEEDCKGMISMFDRDGDGMLSLDEFKLMIGKTAVSDDK